MDKEPTRAKSCGPQLPEADQPAHDWDVDRLGEYAQRQNAAIAKQEPTLTPYYWRLGNALSLARKNFTHGQWKAFLMSIGVDKTRSSKACAIYRTFPAVEAVENLSVDEAYQARREKPTTLEPHRPGAGSELLIKFGKLLAKAEQMASQLFATPAPWSASEQQELLNNLQHAIACLQEHATQVNGALEAARGDTA